MNSIRQHIIDLIRQYIYTNGAQKITGAQLQEILLEIANAFALNGGIDTVLATGSTVSNGRVITNEQNGTFRLEAEAVIGEQSRRYIGADVYSPTLVTACYVGSDFAGSGIVKRNDASRSIFEILAGSLEKGEISAFTNHGIEEEEPRDERGGRVARAEAEPTTNAQVTSAVRTLGTASYDRVRIFDIENMVRNSDYIASNKITAEEINSMVYTSTGDGSRSSVNQTRDDITHYINGGPQTSSHVQRTLNFETRVSNNGQDFLSVQNHLEASWSNNLSGEIARINGSGVSILQGKRITVNQNGSAPTAGWAKLVAGNVNVTTSAVHSNSAISISVQETGTYAGRIRVASKTAGSGFSLSSSNETDTCTVFWQIIDVE